MLIALLPVLISALPGAQSIDQGGAKLKPFVQVPKEMIISPAGTNHWTKTKMTLGQLGEKVAAATAGLKNTVGILDMSVQTPEGLGVYRNPSMLFKVMDGRRYRIDYLVVQKMPFTCSLVADGTNRIVRLDEQIVRKPLSAKMGSPKESSASLVHRFELDFSRMLFQGLTEGIDAWKSLFHGWASNYEGYQPIVEERRVTYQKHLFLSYRVRVERDATSAKKLGVSAIEIVIDGERFLPVTIRNVRRDLKNQLWFTFWACGYRFRDTIKQSEMTLGG